LPLGVLEADELSQQVEEEFLAVANRHTPEQMGHFKQLTATVAQLIQSGYDIMGDLFQLLEIHNPRAAQYFTPPDVAALMVRLGMGNLKEQIEDRGRVTIADHACGSGGLLLAAADYIESLGYDPKEVAVFEGIDIDRDCFNMAYIQLSLRGLQAVIHHGNTLTLKITETRCTPMLRMYQCWQWDMEQRRKKDEGIAAMFALVGCTSKIPFEPVPFMQWAVMPKPKSGFLSTALDDLLNDGVDKDNDHSPTGSSTSRHLESTALGIEPTLKLEHNNHATPKPKKIKSNRIDVTRIQQLNLFDL
jgi:N-6 DNA Methylase